MRTKRVLDAAQVRASSPSLQQKVAPCWDWDPQWRYGRLASQGGIKADPETALALTQVRARELVLA